MEKKIKPLEQLAEQINNFDTYYEMSDDARVIDKGSEDQALIQTQLDYISDEDLDYVLLHLTKAGMENYNRYFNPEEDDMGVVDLNY